MKPMKTTAVPVTPELVLVLEDIVMTPTRVAMRQHINPIMETSTLKPWDTY